MKTLTILITAISLFLYGCSNTSEGLSKEQMENVSDQKNHLIEESEAIELNNGEKWKVDVNMMAHIRNMENDVIAFAKAEQNDYESLSLKLQANINLLTSNCTMKGKAHDELHKWLLPYIDVVEEFSEAKNETEAANQFKNIQTSFTIFNQYFQ